MAAFKILRPGLFTTVQDCGRWGHQAQGVPVSGAMDVYSHRLANHVIGNPANAATLEVTMTGPHVEFLEAAVVAVCGAEFRLTLNDAMVPMNEAIAAGPGSFLRFGDRMMGARAYLAVAGGVDVPPVLGSRSTHVVTRMGGHQGRALRAGDLLPVGRKKGAVPLSTEKGAVPLFPLFPAGGATLRVIAGELIDRLAGRRFTVSPRSDRMGYRLEGSAEATRVAPAELISRAVPTGAVQMPPGGQPILLMADHATSGGYAVAATVITADLPVAGQLAPGDWVEFTPCSLEEADAASRALEASLASLSGGSS
jgi:antagonist of KipI